MNSLAQCRNGIFNCLSLLTLATGGLLLAAPATAAGLNGQVLGGGMPIANSTVTLWAASAGTPKQLAQARSGTDGRFTLKAPAAPTDDGARQQAAGQSHDQ